MQALSLYSCLQKWRNTTFLILAASIVVAIFSIFNAKIENNGLVFIPDDKKDLKTAARILAQAPGANVLFVDIEGDNPQNAARLVENTVPSELAATASQTIRNFAPELMTRAFPLYFSKDVEKMLDDQIAANGVSGIMRDNRKLLEGFGALAMADWIRIDPLQLRNICRKIFPEQISLFNKTLSGDGRHALLVFRPSENALNTSSAQKLVEAVKNSVPPGYRLTMSGTPVYTAANAKAVENDLFRIIAFSIAGFIGIYAFLARSWGALWILFTALASTILAMGVTGLCWPSTSGIALGFGASLMGLSEDYAAHMHFALRSGNDQPRIYVSMERPLFQSFLLNSSGFFFLFFSSVPVIRQMAFFAIISLFVGFIVAMSVLPFIKSFTLPRNVHETVTSMGKKPSVARCSLLCFPLLLVCAFLYQNVEFNFSPRAMAADSENISADTAKIKKIWELNTPSAIIIEGQSKDDAIKSCRKLAERLRMAGAKNVVSPSDFMVPADEGRENANRWRKWVADNHIPALLNSEGQAVGFAKNAFEPFLNILASEPVELEAAEKLLMVDNLAIIRVEALPNEFVIPDTDRMLVFSPEIIEQGIYESFQGEQKLMLFTAIVIILLLCFLLRNPGRIMAVVIPPIFSVATVLGVFIFFEMSFTLAALSVMPIIFGLSLDHGIMVTHALGCRRARGIRSAVVVASLTAFLSIGLLAMSSHPALRTMGVVILSGLAGELIAALWLVPMVYPKARTCP